MSKHRKHEEYTNNDNNYNNNSNYNRYNTSASGNYMAPDLNGIVKLLNTLDMSKLSSILSNIKLNNPPKEHTKDQVEDSQIDLDEIEDSRKVELINAIKLILNATKEEILKTLAEINTKI